MSLPSYKNILKRSRSSIDGASSREDAIQGVALVCGAGADVDDLLRSSFLSKRRAASDVAHTARAGSTLIDQAFLLPTLARAPSYPFESNKELIRWLLSGKTNVCSVLQRRTLVTRRRKCSPEPALDVTASSKDTVLLQSPTLASDLSSIAEGTQASQGDDCPVLQVIVALDCNSTQVSPRDCADLGQASTSAVPVTASEPPQNLAVNRQPLAEGAQQCACSEASTSVTGLERRESSQRTSCCIARVSCPQFSVLSVWGRCREMEDTYRVEPDFVLLPCNALGGCRCHDQAFCGCSSFHFFGVFDGHGGAQASSYCRIRLHKALTDELIKAVRFHVKSGQVAPADWSLRWRRVMEASFQKIDEEVGGVCPTGKCSSKEGSLTCCIDTIAPYNVGTTAVVAVLGPCQIIVANCGDSRAVLSRGGKAVPLSQDHKPNREDETSRIIAAGGRIILWEGYRVGGLLAMSRAIGDRYLKEYVIAAPEVTCIERSKEDECLILASDGLWDVMSNEMVCDVARRRLRVERRKCANLDKPSGEETAAGATAALLTKLALSKGSKDNITVIVIDLKSHCKKLV